MGYAEHLCPRCGAPQPAQASGLVHCTYCATPLVPTRDGFQISSTFTDDDLVDPARPRFWLGGTRYRVLGRLGRGETSDVFLALRDHRLTERVRVKALRAHGDRDLFDTEWETLSTLQRSTARGAPHFTRLLPLPVAHGEARLGVHGHEGPRRLSVLGFPSGFVHTFQDVRAAYPKGVPATAAVWMWKRVVELLGFVHDSGFVHGAVLPRHLLVHARDHGVRLCGWSCATRIGARLPALVEADAAFYPDDVARAGAASVAADLMQSARAILWLLGGEIARAPSDTPKSLSVLLEATATAAPPKDARALLSAIDEAAGEAFGPPKFIAFAMPGWNIAAS